MQNISMDISLLFGIAHSVCKLGTKNTREGVHFLFSRFVLLLSDIFGLLLFNIVTLILCIYITFVIAFFCVWIFVF